MKPRRTNPRLELTLRPLKVTSGSQKLAANVKNTSERVLRSMVFLLHSLNESLSAKGDERFIYALMPGQETKVELQVFVVSNAQVYFSLSGFKNGDVFFSLDSPLYQIIIEETTPVTEIKAA